MEYIWMVVVGIVYIFLWVVVIYDLWGTARNLDKFDVLDWLITANFASEWIVLHIIIITIISFVAWLIKICG